MNSLRARLCQQCMKLTLPASRFGQSIGAIYLEDDKIVAGRGARRVIVHGLANTLQSVRYDDILFTIPNYISSDTAKKAARILSLSPPEYIESLEASDGIASGVAKGTSPHAAGAAASDIIVDADSLWEHYGVEYQAPEWNETFKAKSACVAALRDMKLKQEGARAKIAQRGPRRLYNQFLSEGKDKISTIDAFSALFPEVTGEIQLDSSDTNNDQHRDYLLALHDVLLDDSEHFVLYCFGTLTNSEFVVRKRDELECLREVRAWIRTSATEVQNFVATAEHRIQQIQELVTEQVEAPSSKPRTSPLHWSESDHKILAFLECSLEMRRNLQVNPYEAAAALLLRKCSLNILNTSLDDRVSPVLKARQATINFLKSVGVYQPWENLTLRQKESDIIGRMSILAISSMQGDTQLDTTVPIDGLDEQRHDFGKLPVYVIDDISASELDDGLSVESCPHQLDSHGRPTYWAHIHIADSTAYLSPTSALSNNAKKYRTALYLPEFTLPMFPEAVMQARGWSLGSIAQGQRVLTFSARLDLDGYVYEKNVRAGIVNNIVATTYSAVDEALGLAPVSATPKTASDASALTLSWPPHSNAKIHLDPTPDRSLSNLGESAKDDLAILHKLHAGLLRQRVGSGYVGWSNVNSSPLSLHPRPFLSSVSLPGTTSAQVPHLQLHLAASGTAKDDFVPAPVSTKLVAEYMILAGRIAASRLSERSVPGLYRAQDEPVAADQQSLVDLLASRDPTTGEIPPEATKERRISFLPAYYAAKPSSHWPMGITAESGGYAQATSPLRRFNDMVVHWQLKSTLYPRSSSNSVSTRKPIFSLDDMDHYIRTYTPLDRLLKRIEQRSRTFWRLFLISKKLEQVKADPSSEPQVAELFLNGLTAKVISSKRDYASLQTIVSVIVPELGGIPATLMLDPSHIGIEEGTRFNIEIAGMVLDDFSRMFVKLR